MIKTSLVFIPFFLFPLYSVACTMVCLNSVSVDLGNSCQYTVVYQDILESPPCAGANLVVTVNDASGTIPTSPTINGNYIGQTLTVLIEDLVNNTSCFGFVEVNDMISPILNCTDISVDCFEDYYAPSLPTVSENCGNPQAILINETLNTLNCDPDLIANIDLIYRATDSSGNSSECSVIVDINRPDFSVITYPADRLISNGMNISCDAPQDLSGFPDPSVSGYPNYNNQSMSTLNLSDCNLAMAYNDNVISNVGCVEKISRNWTITESWCGSTNQTTHIQIIDIVDSAAPSMVCISDITLNLDAFGVVQLDPSMLDAGSFDNCGSTILSTSTNSFFCNDLSSSPLAVTLNGTDDCGNQSSCFSTVTLQDNIQPTCLLTSNISVSLDNTGQYIFSPLDLLDSESDNCSSGFTYNIIPQAVFCNDIGSPVSVQMTIIDESGNQGNCFTNVNVIDPLGACIPQNLILTGVINSSATFQASEYIQMDAIVPIGVSVILLSPEVFTIDGFEVELGGELEIIQN